ncbi:MAG: response regulator, partial [Acidimicrobiales bacterium]|nr:response regulator [Acidimicrobiales bacterium]
VHSDDRLSLKQVLSDIAEGKSTQARIRFRLKNVEVGGSESRWVMFETNIRPIVAPHGGVSSMVAISRDVSEQVALEERLEQAVQVANSANNAKTEFLARMSHELRTPLNAILGFGQLLEREELDEMAADSVKRIVSAGKHLLSLINEVLDLAKIESGYISLSIENIEIGSVIREVISIMEPLAKSRSVTIKAEGEINEGNHFVVADVQRFKQVMINLVSNAVKYNKEGGFIEISISNMGENTRVEVSDSGKGISKKYYDKVFAPFERLGAEQSAVEGTGVGLSLCKKIAEAMNGKLYFTSEEGKGSSFYLELASSMAETSHQDVVEYSAISPQGSSDSRHLVGSRKVLYIEDNVANIALVERIFQAWPSLELITASQGSLGLDLLSADQFDMVLLDLHLPDIQGDEVLRRIKADPNTAEIPVVIISASAMSSDVKSLNDQGAAGYLTKPIDVKTLEDTVRFHLGGIADES